MTAQARAASHPAPEGRPGSPRTHDLAERLQVEVEDHGLLGRALTHRSWSFENGQVPTNERLEFLGDAVLALVVTDHVFNNHPGQAEGRLAKLRAAAVKSGSLAGVAREVDLGQYVLLGRGEEMSGGRDKDSILADTLEAVIGAVYLDRGYGVVAELVLRLFTARLEELSGQHASLDYKTALQELSAARFDTLPNYRVTAQGPDHARVFTAEVVVGGTARGNGVGRSKKQAEQDAARTAYRSLVDDVAADDG